MNLINGLIHCVCVCDRVPPNIEHSVTFSLRLTAADQRRVAVTALLASCSHAVSERPNSFYLAVVRALPLKTYRIMN